MSSQPKIRNKQRKGNILKYTIPGLQKEIDIPFPDRKLPVCTRCKKIYKTRELCRVRDGHTDVAWNTTHLCVNLDDSCFAENARGDLCLVDESNMKFVANHIKGPGMPYRTKKSDALLANTPICMACKQKNYTRNHCRDKQKHRQLPWGTVYVTLSAVPLPKESIIEEDNTVSEEDSTITEKSTAGMKRNMLGESVSLTTKSDAKRRRVEMNTGSNADVIADSIWEVAPSRTFLLTITGKSSTLQVSLFLIYTKPTI